MKTIPQARNKLDEIEYNLQKINLKYSEIFNHDFYEGFASQLRAYINQDIWDEETIGVRYSLVSQDFILASKSAYVPINRKLLGKRNALAWLLDWRVPVKDKEEKKK